MIEEENKKKLYMLTEIKHRVLYLLKRLEEWFVSEYIEVILEASLQFWVFFLFSSSEFLEVTVFNILILAHLLFILHLSELYHMRRVRRCFFFFSRLS
jgi:hypothetical protein